MLRQITTVNGVLENGIFTALKAACPSPVSVLAPITPSWTPVTTTDVSWNFNAWLIGKNGVPWRRYDTAVDPRDTLADVQALLSQ